MQKLLRGHGLTCMQFAGAAYVVSAHPVAQCRCDNMKGCREVCGRSACVRCGVGDRVCCHNCQCVAVQWGVKQVDGEKRLDEFK